MGSIPIIPTSAVVKLIKLFSLLLLMNAVDKSYFGLHTLFWLKLMLVRVQPRPQHKKYNWASGEMVIRDKFQILFFKRIEIRTSSTVR